METPPNPPEFIPPPIIVAPAPKPRKSRGWMIASIILIVLLAASLFGNLTQFVMQTLSLNRVFHSDTFGTAREVGPRLEEVFLENNKSENKIAVITIAGIITGQGVDGEDTDPVAVIQAQLDRASDDKNVKGVLLKMDSPGGEVLASDEIYRAIRDFEDTSKKPVVCSMGNLAASGGYYISSGCRWIVANELTLTGSIGVIMHGYNYRGLMDKFGIVPTTYKSGLYKDMLSPDRSTNEIPAGEHKMVQDLIDETYEKFKGVVADGRAAAHAANNKEGRALADNWQDFADGRVVSGKQALDLGLVDELGDFDDAVERTEKITGIKDSNLIEYRQHYDITDFLSLFGQSSKAHDIKFDLGIDVPKLHAGYLYFLAPTFVN
jgi:protease-4